jgi:hypothetical protein
MLLVNIGVEPTLCTPDLSAPRWAVEVDTGMVVEMGVDADLDALGGWMMMMRTRVRTATATTAVGRPHHLDINDADADDSRPDSGMTWILTPTPTC